MPEASSRMAAVESGRLARWAAGLASRFRGRGPARRRLPNTSSTSTAVFVTAPGTPPQTVAQILARARDQYQQLVDKFADQTGRLGCEHLRQYYWYHTIDLGDGLITPGDYDFRPALQLFGFPEDMPGMNVLDVGSASGFFAFEFEKRGANVISVDLPSIADWDMPTIDKPATLQDLMACSNQSTLAGVDDILVHGGFEAARTLLRSRVKRCLSCIYDLSATKLGVGGFDLIFAGDLLVHTMSPLKALDVLATLCKGTLIIAQDCAEVYEAHPVLQYFGGSDRGGDQRSWWHPNKACWEQMLKRVGFKTVEFVGEHIGVVSRQWIFYKRAIIHATK